MHGKVQGVFFRASARRQAQSLGLAGFVRNRRDGSVEVDIEGDAVGVGRMLEWLDTGPELAAVAGLDVSELPLAGDDEFEVRR